MCALLIGGRYAVPWLAREFWPTGNLCALADSSGRLSVWAKGVLVYRRQHRMYQEEAAFKQRDEEISSELESRGVPRDEWGAVDNPPWAGSYLFIGADWGMTLKLSPNAGFTFSSDSCPDGSYRNHGSIAEASDDDVRLAPFIDLRLPHALRMPAAYVPVRWGELRLMIPVEEMVGFCNDVRDDPESAPWNAYLSNRAWENVPPGEPLPHVPARWLPYLTPPDVVALVTSVAVAPAAAPDSDYSLQLALDKGSADGLLPGMRLFSDQSDFRSVEVTTTNESSAIVVTGFYENFSQPYRKPRVGDRYRTKRPSRAQ